MAVSQTRSAPAACRLAAARFQSTDAPATTGDVVVPELVETLEWVLDTPPPLHQFEESPIIVEIAGLEPAASRS